MGGWNPSVNISTETDLWLIYAARERGRERDEDQEWGVLFTF